MSEVGYQSGSGLTSWGAFSTDVTETNPDLMWPKSITVYDKMRNEDSQVGSVLRAVTLPIRKARWVLDPAGARDEVVELVAADLGLPIKGRPPQAPLRTRGRFSWGEHLRLALLELPHGHSCFEQVYVFDGQWHRLHKLAWRPPRTIAEFKVARDGGLEAIVQHGMVTGLQGLREITIPVDRLVVYVNEREGGNWLGRSLLRQAYKNWLLKDRILRIQALTVERNGLGVPVYTGAPIPDGVEDEKAIEWQNSEKDAGLKLAKGFKAGESAGASLPHGADLSLKGVEGKLPDTDGPIRYHDEQIARAVLAHFLNLGTETGSWALGSTFAKFFTDSLNAVAEHIADVTQQHVIEDLVDANWGPTEPAPRIICEPIGEQMPATAEAIKALIECRALTPDPALEAHLRNQYDLPVMAAELAAKGVPVDAARDVAEQAEIAEQAVRAAAEAGASDADVARFAAEVVQKVYLGVGTVIDQEEARDIVRRAGAKLKGATP